MRLNWLNDELTQSLSSKVKVTVTTSLCDDITKQRSIWAQTDVISPINWNLIHTPPWSIETYFCQTLFCRLMHGSSVVGSLSPQPALYPGAAISKDEVMNDDMMKNKITQLCTQGGIFNRFYASSSPSSPSSFRFVPRDSPLGVVSSSSSSSSRPSMSLSSSPSPGAKSSPSLSSSRPDFCR